VPVCHAREKVLSKENALVLPTLVRDDLVWKDSRTLQRSIPEIINYIY
jgi:hypothetical protein